jgi:riboflavin biosynthesis pyrimidine reductase
MNPSLIPVNLPLGINVIASLLIDPMGRVREGSSSRPLSSPEDRQRFLSLRTLADCILVGRRTWESESYSKTKTPVVVYSRRINPITQWNLEILRLQREYGPQVVIEAGPDLLGQLLKEDVIDRLYLTKTSRESRDESSPRFDLETFLFSETMELIESIAGEEDFFEVYQRRSLST